MRYTYVLWDWNGTLTDDQVWAMQAVNDMLARRGRAPITCDDYYAQLKTPIRKFYEYFFDLQAENYDDILREYNRGYADYMQRCGTLRPGMETLLGDIRAAGMRQWIVTSSHTAEVNAYLHRFRVDQYFEKVLGAENYHAESKVERVCAAVREANIPPSHVLLVGDTLHDLETATALQAHCVLLAGGHQSVATLSHRQAPVCHSLDELRKELGL